MVLLCSRKSPNSRRVHSSPISFTTTSVSSLDKCLKRLCLRPYFYFSIVSLHFSLKYAVQNSFTFRFVNNIPMHCWVPDISIEENEGTNILTRKFLKTEFLEPKPVFQTLATFRKELQCSHHSNCQYLCRNVLFIFNMLIFKPEGEWRSSIVQKEQMFDWNEPRISN